MATKPSIEPIQKIEAWPLSVAIWMHEGNDRPYYSTTLQRTFIRDGAGDAGKEYCYTDSLNRDDLLLGAKLLDEAHSAILRLEQADFAKRQQQGKR